MLVVGTVLFVFLQKGSGMEPIRKSVSDYIEASKRLLESDGLSPKERDTLLKYVNAIEHLVQTHQGRDSEDA